MTTKLISTTLYKNANEISFDDFVGKMLNDFEFRVLKIYKTIKCNKANDSDEELTLKTAEKLMYNTGFYKLYEQASMILKAGRMDFPFYQFHINPKNINFETLLTDVKDRFEHRIILRSQCESPVDDRIVEIKDIPNWKELFGAGEFPFFNIYAFRLGNTEYYTYTITR